MNDVLFAVSLKFSFTLIMAKKFHNFNIAKHTNIADTQREIERERAKPNKNYDENQV